MSNLPGHGLERMSRDVTARGVRMRVVECGEGNGPAVILIHDVLVSHISFDDVIEALAERFHVIAPDLPGFGESEKPSPTRYSYGIESAAEAIADLIAAFGVGRAHLVGHSMGAAIALTLAANHPELVQRLVLEDALCYPAPKKFRERITFVPILGGILFKQLWGLGMFRAQLRDEASKPSSVHAAERIDLHYKLFNTPSARESAHAMLHAISDTRGVVARITRVTAPALVVWGRDDKKQPVANAGRLVRELHSAKLEIMDAGHFPHEERPEQFAALVTQFLEGRR